MRKFAEITDKGECYSSLNLVIEGVNANAAEWKKSNFYPQNGMVGEIVLVQNPYTHILKVHDNYVPMSPNGIREISEKEFSEKVNGNSFTGMDERQKSINKQYEEFMDKTLYSSMPNYKDAFWSDIVKIITEHTDNYTKLMFMPQLIDECVMYACLMCLEFKKKADILPDSWKKHISSQVCDVFDEHFKEFGDYERSTSMTRIDNILSSYNAESRVKNYYDYLWKHY